MVLFNPLYHKITPKQEQSKQLFIELPEYKEPIKKKEEETEERGVVVIELF